MYPAARPEHVTPDETNFESIAWLLVGSRRTLAGRLSLRGGQLTFAAANRQVHLSAPAAEIEAVWSPWYYFGGGLKLKAAGETYRFAFVLPNDQAHVLGGWRRTYALALPLTQVSLLVRLFPEFVLGRLLTRWWLALLSGRP